MAESVRGGTAAPHPATKQKNSLSTVIGATPTGTFALKIEGLSRTITSGNIAYNAAAGAVKTAITGATGAAALGAVDTTGGALGASPVVITFPNGPVKVTITGSTLSVGTTAAVVQTVAAGFITAKNVTMANPTNATQAGGQMRKPTYRSDYRTKSTPAEVHKDRDGTTLTPGGAGVTATKSVR